MTNSTTYSAGNYKKPLKISQSHAKMPLKWVSLSAIQRSIGEYLTRRDPTIPSYKALKKRTITIQYPLCRRCGKDDRVIVYYCGGTFDAAHVRKTRNTHKQKDLTSRLGAYPRSFPETLKQGLIRINRKNKI
jgi:hypothetical protein